MACTYVDECASAVASAAEGRYPPGRSSYGPRRATSPADVGVYPGGRFDPLKFSEKVDMEEMKIKELKHCRLAMGAFLGCLAQQAYTGVGPVANLSAHVSDPSHNFFGSQTAPWNM